MRLDPMSVPDSIADSALPTLSHFLAKPRTTFARTLEPTIGLDSWNISGRPSCQHNTLFESQHSADMKADSRGPTTTSCTGRKIIQTQSTARPITIESTWRCRGKVVGPVNRLRFRCHTLQNCHCHNFSLIFKISVYMKASKVNFSAKL